MYDALRIQRAVMTAVASWPKERYSPIYFLRLFFGIVLFLIAYIIYVIDVIKNIGDIMKLPYVLYMTMALSSFVVKFFWFLHKRASVHSLTKQLKDPIFYTYPENLDVLLKRSINVSILFQKGYLGLCTGFIMVYFIFPVFYRMELPSFVSMEFGRYKLYVFISQLWAIIFGVCTNGNMDLLIMTIMNLASAQFDILKGKIEKIREIAVEEILERSPNLKRVCFDGCIFKEVDDLVCEKLKNVVEHHNAIIR